MVYMHTVQHSDATTLKLTIESTALIFMLFFMHK